MWYFHSARPLGHAQSWYWCVCLSVCLYVCPPPAEAWTFGYLLDTLDFRYLLDKNEDEDEDKDEDEDEDEDIVEEDDKDEAEHGEYCIYCYWILYMS